MAQPTVANMKAIAQTLVLDTGTTNPGLSATDWLVLLNDALFMYAEMFPHVLPMSGLVGTLSLTSGQSGGTLTLNALTASDRDITSAFVRGASGCERAELTDLLRLIATDTTIGVPSRWALFSSGPGLAATSWVYTLKTWPLADAAYSIDFYGSMHPVTLTGDSDYTPFQEPEARTIARIAAVEAARLLGRPGDFIAGVAGPLPDQIRAKLGLALIDSRPREYEGKSSV